MDKSTMLALYLTFNLVSILTLLVIILLYEKGIILTDDEVKRRKKNDELLREIGNLSPQVVLFEVSKRPVRNDNDAEYNAKLRKAIDDYINH